MAKYYFKTTGTEPDVESTERCMVKNDGVMIGSVICQQCVFCTDNDKDAYGEISWIVCSKIEEATKK